MLLVPRASSGGKLPVIQCKGINKDRLSQEVVGRREGLQRVGEKNKVESYCFKMYYIFSVACWHIPLFLVL